MTVAVSAVEQWSRFELELAGPSAGNPFVEVELEAEFRRRNHTYKVRGYYDGNGVYGVRFMPDAPGTWQYRTYSNSRELDGLSGEFTCIPAEPGNHGPVGVAYRYHFAYADGTPFRPLGTTCYGWNHQAPTLQEQTLQTLAASPFNKLRMCIPPKWYRYNRREPSLHPFAGDVQGARDFSRFNPSFFRRLESQIQRLLELGVEADLILFHSYDRWGYADMGPEADQRYLRYVIARLGAFRNIWWSLANEYDLLPEKTMSDWDRHFRTVAAEDPYHHLRSIHNARQFYDHSKGWVTHVSCQRHPDDRILRWRAEYGKPIICDEFGYEGNIETEWGSLSAQEMVFRCWRAVCRGAYASHGETFAHADDILWWSHGGVLHGESPKRLAFLRTILEDLPAGGLTPMDVYGTAAAVDGRYCLYYFDHLQPAVWDLQLPGEGSFKLEAIDTWGMTIAPIDGTYKGQERIELSGRPHQLVRARRVE